jgi:hypothetical protein
VAIYGRLNLRLHHAAAATGVLLTVLAGCSQPWRFARPDVSSGTSPLSTTTVPAGNQVQYGAGKDAVAAASYVANAPAAAPGAGGAGATLPPVANAPPPGQPPSGITTAAAPTAAPAGPASVDGPPPSYSSQSPCAAPAGIGGDIPAVALNPAGSPSETVPLYPPLVPPDGLPPPGLTAVPSPVSPEIMGAPGPVPSQPALPGEPLSVRQRLLAMAAGDWENIGQDYRHFYTVSTGLDMLAGMGVAAAMAYTVADVHTLNWYQGNVRNSATNSAANVAKQFGEWIYMVPTALTLEVVGTCLADNPSFAVMGDYGDRVMRAYLVGGPPMLFMQYAIGTGRPTTSTDSSRWTPFAFDNGVSGHAFVGSIPFITAANMTDNRMAKVFFYACSVLPGLSRINDNAHFPSQVLMGWWMGYLACNAVDETQHANARNWTITPVFMPEMNGVQITYAF